MHKLAVENIKKSVLFRLVVVISLVCFFFLLRFCVFLFVRHIIQSGEKKTILKLTVTRPSYSNSTNLPMKKMCSICVQGCMICSARCTFQGWISELQIVTCGARFLCVCNIYIRIGSYVSVIFRYIHMSEMSHNSWERKRTALIAFATFFFLISNHSYCNILQIGLTMCLFSS